MIHYQFLEFVASNYLPTMYQYFDLLRVSKYIVGTDVLILICIYEVSKPLKNYKKLIEIHTRHRRNYDIHNIGTLKLCLLTDLRREDKRE